MKSYSYSLILISLFFFYPALASGWSITPSVLSIDPAKSQGVFSITADTNEKPIAVEITVLPRFIDEDGKETLGPPTKDFIVYPSHVIIKNDETKTIRAIWRGSKNLAEEKAFRLVATSLPVNVVANSQNSTGEDVSVNISLSTKYLNSLYLTPKKAKPDVKCTKAYLQQKDGHEGMIVVELTNRGNAHQFINDFGLDAESAFKKFSIPKELVKKHYGEGINILANTTRKLYFPVLENNTSSTNAYQDMDPN